MPLGFTRTGLAIGRSGIGTLNVRDGASVVVDGTPGRNPGAVLTAGLQAGSHGTISVSGPGSTIEVRGPSNTSRTELMDGVPVTFGVTGNIGFNGTGRLEVASGGQVVVSGTDVSTGERAGFLDVGRNPGSTGSALVSGTGSELNVASTVRLGGPSNPSGGQNEPGGTGLLTVVNGGVVRTGQVQVGAGSTLNGNGTIIGDVVNLGGVVSPGLSSPGTLTVLGNYLHEAGLLHLDVAPTGHDLLQVTGTLGIDPLDSVIRILLDPSLGAAPGTLFDLVRSGSGDILSLMVLGEEFAPRGTGIFAGLLAEHPDVVQLQPVPEPSTLILLGSGLAALAGLARRRYRRK